MPKSSRIARLLGAKSGLEDVLESVVRNRCAEIADGYRARRRIEAIGAHVDVAARSAILDGVVEQVHEDLGDRHCGVACDLRQGVEPAGVGVDGDVPGPRA